MIEHLMTAEQIDKQLLLWKRRMEAAAHGLAELSALPTYDALDTLALSGETKARIGPAVLALKRVWRDYDLLVKAVQQATDLRSRISAFSMSRQNWDDIEAILTGPCVPANERLKLADRNLLTAEPTDSGVTLDELHNDLNAAFRQGRDGVLEIEASWKAINAKLSAAKQFLDAHPSEAAAGLGELREQVEELRPRALHDPLGVNREFDARIAGVLQQAQLEIAKLEERRRNLQADLAAARQLLKTLDELRIKNDEAWRECKEKIAGRLAEPALPLERISEWNGTIEKLARQCEGAAIDRTCEELARAISELRRLIAREQNALTQNRMPLDLRRELRGRLTALKAKASARGRAEEPELAALAERAHGLLYTRPTPIDEALTTVTQYQALLNKQEMKQA